MSAENRHLAGLYRTEPCFSPAAQETFVPGARVFVPVHAAARESFEVEAGLGEEIILGGGNGTFVGWLGTDEHSPKTAVVDWDELGVRESSFDLIRNLYR